MTTLSESRRIELTDELASAICRLGMQAPAVWLLELYRPLGFLGAQALLFLQPLLGVWTGDEVIRDYAAFLEEPGAVERLLQGIEQRVQERLTQKGRSNGGTQPDL